MVRYGAQGLPFPPAPRFLAPRSFPHSTTSSRISVNAALRATDAFHSTRSTLRCPSEAKRTLLAHGCSTSEAILCRYAAENNALAPMALSRVSAIYHALALRKETALRSRKQRTCASGTWHTLSRKPRPYAYATWQIQICATDTFLVHYWIRLSLFG